MPHPFAGRKVLVTGGAGFIGSHASEALLEAGCNVHVLDDLSGGFRENVADGAVFHEMDIRSGEVERLFEKERFDAMLHLAAQMDVRRSVADPAFDASVNILGLLNLLKAGQKSGLQRVVFASTGGAIYGEPDPSINNGGPQPEQHPTTPASPYGIAKLVSEHYLRFFHATYGLPFVALRLGNIYGPRQNPHGEAGVVAIFTQKLFRGEQPVINGPGEQTRDYVYVGDVVRAMVKAFEIDTAAVLNIGTGRETSVNELYKLINTLTEVNAPEIHAEAKAGEQERSVLDASLAGERLGWRPQVELEEGLARTVAWFKERT